MSVVLEAGKIADSGETLSKRRLREIYFGGH